MKRDTVGILVCLGFLALLGWVIKEVVIGDPQNPYAFNSIESADGLPLYEANCEMCHGRKATGGVAPRLDFDATWRYGVSDWEKFQNVRFGIAGTSMAAFPDLTDDEVWRILGYVNNIDYIPHPEDMEEAVEEGAGDEGAAEGDHAVDAASADQ